MGDINNCDIEVKKKKNVGKQFEKDWKDSIPESVFYYRFKDGTAAWGGTQENTRFQHQNISDCMLFHNSKLYILELKTVQGKSFSFANVRQNQLTEMQKASQFLGITAGFVINFRDLEKTIFIDVNEFVDIMNRSDKKSFNQKDLEFHNYSTIKSLKLKVHYRYKVDDFLDGYG
jgi:recombination protein U